MDYEKWMKEAERVIDMEIENGQRFEVKNLIPGHQWNTLSRGERTGFGIHFSTAVKEGRVKSVEKCGEGKTHHSQYIKTER